MVEAAHDSAILRKILRGSNLRWSRMMVEVAATAVIEAGATLTAEVDVRYSFTAQYLVGGAMFARASADIEKAHPKNPPEDERTRHSAFVTAAVMQSAASVEAESAEITLHGPWHHLSGDKADETVLKFLKPLAEFIDKQESLDRFQIIHHLLGKPEIPKDKNPWQDMSTLVKLRNELVHYKSKWRTEMDRQKFFTGRLLSLGLAPPPFVDCSGSNVFPHQLLGSACATWAVKTALAFIQEVYRNLGIESPLNSYLGQFGGL